MINIILNSISNIINTNVLWYKMSLIYNFTNNINLRLFNLLSWKTSKIVKVQTCNLGVGTSLPAHPYHIVDQSPWPLALSGVLLSLTISAALSFHGYVMGDFLLTCSFVLLIWGMSLWFKDIITEASYLGAHTDKVQKGISLGVVLFIISEVFFFLSIFWAYFHSSLAPAIEIGGEWPPKGIEPVDASEVPTANTTILLSSGSAVTVSHHSLVNQLIDWANYGSVATIVLAVLFTGLQVLEYIGVSYTITDSVFGSTFFMATGFHGLHVIIGTLFLLVGAIRIYSYQVTNTHHVGVESGILYWRALYGYYSLLIYYKFIPLNKITYYWGNKYILSITIRWILIRFMGCKYFLNLHWKSILNRVIMKNLHSFSSVDAHNQDKRNIYRLKICQILSELVDIYKMKLQFILYNIIIKLIIKIVGPEEIRLFNNCDGNNNDGRLNNINYYSLDLLNKKTVMFLTSKILNSSYKLRQRKFNFTNKRYYSTSNVKSNKSNYSIDYSENYTGELNIMAKSLIKQNIWPMDNIDFRYKAILLKRREESKIGKQCANIFNNTQNLIAILQSNTITDEPRKIILNKLLEDSSSKIENVIWKIIAIEITSKSSGSLSPGVDGVFFQKVAAKADNRQRASRILLEEAENLKQAINLAKGKTNQAIVRKGIKNLNDREKLRRFFKKEGRQDIIKKRMKLKELLSNPIFEAEKLRKESIEHNIKLKFKLLDSLKYNKLLNFKADPIKRVYIPKPNSDKVRSLGIPTIKDRCVQMLLKIILEPIMEPLGDNTSFAYRRGRNTHLAVCCLSNSLVFKRRGGDKRKRQMTFKGTVNRRKVEKKVPEFYSTKQIIDCDIKGFFDNISHDWLLKNVPLSNKYKHILLAFLKAPIIYDSSVINEVTNSGLIQGGIISPLLANWTLDGLEETIQECVKVKTNHPWSGYFYPKGKEEHLIKLKLLKDISPRRMIERKGTRNVISLVRYADDIVIITNNVDLTAVIMSTLTSFLNSRGLSLSETKTKIFPWKMGSKLNYLGWTFMLINPRKVTWIIKAKRREAGNLKDWVGMYCVPSKDSTKSLRNKVKVITSMKNTYKSVDLICHELSLLIRGWSNYFCPGGKQSTLRTHLDWYIDRRIRRYLFRKFGPSKIKWAIKRFCRFKDKYIGLHTKNAQGIPSTFKLPFLYKIGVDSPWSLIKPDVELLKTSCITDPTPYIKRKIFIEYICKKDHGLLFKFQKGKCSICDNDLHIYLDNDENLYLNDEEDRFGISHRNVWYLNRIDSNWNYLHNSYKGLQIDHIIPLSFSLNIPVIYNILDELDNKQLIHSTCHKLKTKNDKINIKFFKKLIKDLNNKGLNIMECFKKAIKNIEIKKIYSNNKSYNKIIKNIE